MPAHHYYRGGQAVVVLLVAADPRTPPVELVSPPLDWEAAEAELASLADDRGRLTLVQRPWVWVASAALLALHVRRASS